MRLGIDFGTTRVVVAATDRGNYPIVTFESEDGQACEWYPSLCAIRGKELCTGAAAVAKLRDPEWKIVRSLKRMLATAGPEDTVLGWKVSELLTEFLVQLRTALVERSNLDVCPDDLLEVAVAVPANANSNQRMMTIDAFREAGFRVVRMLDEPSAAGLEYAWRRPTDARVKKRHVAVYDLGGGTFDASIISMGDARHEVITTDGLARLGGDDFDEVLLDLALAAAGESAVAAGPDRDRLLELCRTEKERFSTATKKLKPELYGDKRDPAIKTAEYEEALRPLIEQTLATLDSALLRAQAAIGLDIEKSTVVYQVGGASQLPTVGRMLKEKFGRRVYKSPYAHASIAVGLAIAAESSEEHRLQNRFTRYFGVWREADGGRAAWFDPVIPKDMLLSFPQSAQPADATRRYHAAHNVGHYRFVECSRLRDDGTPAGEITPWGEIRFPIAGDLRDESLDGVDVIRMPGAWDEVEEQYRCTETGEIEVDLVNVTQGYRRTYKIGQRAA
jgi:molecular chaperone DnaK (HSP70)